MKSLAILLLSPLTLFAWTKADKPRYVEPPIVLKTVINAADAEEYIRWLSRHYVGRTNAEAYRHYGQGKLVITHAKAVADWRSPAGPYTAYHYQRVEIYVQPIAHGMPGDYPEVDFSQMGVD